MKLIAFQLTQVYSYDENKDRPLKGQATLKMENGAKVQIDLTDSQAEMIASAVAEMLVTSAKNIGKEMTSRKIEAPRLDNLLEAE